MTHTLKEVVGQPEAKGEDSREMKGNTEGRDPGKICQRSGLTSEGEDELAGVGGGRCGVGGGGWEVWSGGWETRGQR